MLVTTSDCKPTFLCLQAGNEDLSPSHRTFFETDDPCSQYRRIMRGFRRSAFSATSSDLLLAGLSASKARREGDSACPGDARGDGATEDNRLMRVENPMHSVHYPFVKTSE